MTKGKYTVLTFYMFELEFEGLEVKKRNICTSWFCGRKQWNMDWWSNYFDWKQFEHKSTTIHKLGQRIQLFSVSIQTIVKGLENKQFSFM